MCVWRGHMGAKSAHSRFSVPWPKKMSARTLTHWTTSYSCNLHHTLATYNDPPPPVSIFPIWRHTDACSRWTTIARYELFQVRICYAADICLPLFGVICPPHRHVDACCEYRTETIVKRAHSQLPIRTVFFSTAHTFHNFCAVDQQLCWGAQPPGLLPLLLIHCH